VLLQFLYNLFLFNLSALTLISFVFAESVEALDISIVNGVRNKDVDSEINIVISRCLKRGCIKNLHQVKNLQTNL
jgi:hypothetical protein